MLPQIILLCLITMMPALELRASIPYGILGSPSWGITPGLMPWTAVAGLCIGCNIVLGWVLYGVMPTCFALLERYCPRIHRVIDPFIVRSRNRMAPYVRRFGSVGVALFIAVPLPGSGVYTGALGAYVLGLGRRRFMLSCAAGVVGAGVVVTALTLVVRQGMQLPFWTQWMVRGGTP